MLCSPLPGWDWEEGAPHMLRSGTWLNHCTLCSSLHLHAANQQTVTSKLDIRRGSSGLSLWHSTTITVPRRIHQRVPQLAVATDQRIFFNQPSSLKFLHRQSRLPSSSAITTHQIQNRRTFTPVSTQRRRVLRFFTITLSYKPRSCP